jgi:hypothetical protein
MQALGADNLTAFEIGTNLEWGTAIIRNINTHVKAFLGEKHNVIFVILNKVFKIPAKQKNRLNPVTPVIFTGNPFCTRHAMSVRAFIQPLLRFVVINPNGPMAQSAFLAGRYNLYLTPANAPPARPLFRPLDGVCS